MSYKNYNNTLKNSREYYYKNKNNKKYIIKQKVKFNKWRKLKRKRFNELMMNSYKKNKDKWYSRTYTLNIVNGRNKSKKYEIKDKFCKVCGSKENLEIHHEIYPRLKTDIIKAIDNKKIYFLCKKCHKKIM